MKHSALLALTFFYIERGLRQGESRYVTYIHTCSLSQISTQLIERFYRLESIAAASLYFTFLGMPGSGAFKIFHPLLFTKALDVFKVSVDNDSDAKEYPYESNLRWWHCSNLQEQAPAGRREGGRLVGSNTQFNLSSINHQGASQSQSQSQTTMRDEEDGLEELAPEEEGLLMSGLGHAVASLQLTLAHCR